MERSIFRYILKHTRKKQIFLLLLTAASMPFIYVSLEIPKMIINGAIGGADVPEQLLGYPINQISYLFVLSGLFLLLVVFNGAMKYILNVYRGVLGERMLRRFRYELYSRILRFPLPYFKQVSQAEIIPMITTETEPLGGFIGEAFALPAFQGGLLITYLWFIINQDWLLGLMAIAFYPPQMWLIPKLQRKVNALAKQRVMNVRVLSDRVGESIAGIQEIHSHGTGRFERARLADRLGRIFTIRYDLYRRKFFIKFLNNFIAQLTPFFFYSVGGYFVIKGNLSLGGLVAVLSAYKDIASPWKELLKYYQTKEDIRVKYQQIIEQFDPSRLLNRELAEGEPQALPRFRHQLVATNLSFSEDNYLKPVDGASFDLNLALHTAIVGLAGSGKVEISQLMARLLRPTGGRIRVDKQALEALPEAATGHVLSYVDADAHIFTGSIFDNLVYGLKFQPVGDELGEDKVDPEIPNRLEEAQMSGNSSDNPDVDWIDLAQAGVDDHAALLQKILDLLPVTELGFEIYQIGLDSRIHSGQQPELASQVLEARKALRGQLSEEKYQHLVESFDSARYNTNLSVAENLVFGHPCGKGCIDMEQMPSNRLVMQALEQAQLLDDFLTIGYRLAEIMLDLFQDVAPESELFSRFSFINAEDLPLFSSIIKRNQVDTAHEIDKEDRQMLLSLPFKLVVARHRLGLIDEDMQNRLLDARAILQQLVNSDVNAEITIYDAREFNSALTIRDNILFGRLAYGQANARKLVDELMSDTIRTMSLRTRIIEVGLDYHVGTFGARLSNGARQKLALTRCLLKNPDLLIINNAIDSLDSAAERRVLRNLRKYRSGTSLVWVLDRPELAMEFTQLLVVEGGKVVEQGTPTALQQRGGSFGAMLDNQ
ncbi:MAG TPA: ABC transporter ATP-binding protein [Gammaproteobacteria bacterium]|nr:ABC transporter ATP-binding protein [Gammaproteobacteria bacterium]